LDAKAREHLLALKFAPNEWAITPQLAGIHCAAPKPEDFTVYGQLGGAMVWSPLSDLLPYGATANVAAAIAAGVRLGIGSDGRPSGSKNLSRRSAVKGLRRPGSSLSTIGRLFVGDPPLGCMGELPDYPVELLEGKKGTNTKRACFTCARSSKLLGRDEFFIPGRLVAG
jgi:hypothetical protein